MKALPREISLTEARQRPIVSGRMCLKISQTVYHQVRLQTAKVVDRGKLVVASGKETEFRGLGSLNNFLVVFTCPVRTSETELHTAKEVP